MIHAWRNKYRMITHHDQIVLIFLSFDGTLLALPLKWKWCDVPLISVPCLLCHETFTSYIILFLGRYLLFTWTPSQKWNIVISCTYQTGVNFLPIILSFLWLISVYWVKLNQILSLKHQVWNPISMLDFRRPSIKSIAKLWEMFCDLMKLSLLRCTTCVGWEFPCWKSRKNVML